MTGVAVVVRREICRDRQSGSPVHWLGMTADAAVLRTGRAGIVLRVIEFYVERFVEAGGKTLQRRVVALRVGVTDQAHRNRRRRELSAMAVGAGFVTGKARRGGVVGALVTRGAGERAMPLAVVEKLRVISLGALGHG